MLESPKKGRSAGRNLHLSQIFTDPLCAHSTVLGVPELKRLKICYRLL